MKFYLYLFDFISGQFLSSLKKGKGPDTCLLLDMSGSMAGEPFNEMMAAVRVFVEGNLISTMLNTCFTAGGFNSEIFLSYRYINHIRSIGDKRKHRNSYVWDTNRSSTAYDE